jgi:hypothetical protein
MQKVVISSLLSLLLPLVAQASWLSDITGIDINLQKQIGNPKALDPANQPSRVVRISEVIPTPMARPEQKVQLEQQMGRATDTFKRKSEAYESYAMASVIATIVLALLSAIAGFMRKPVAAGVLSLVVIAANGIPKTLPIKDRAIFYQALYGQALTLQVDTSLQEELSVSDFNARATQLTTILLYASKAPGIGDASAVTEELIKEVQRKTVSKS